MKRQVDRLVIHLPGLKSQFSSPPNRYLLGICDEAGQFREIVQPPHRYTVDMFYEDSNSASLRGPSVTSTCLSRMGKRFRERITSSTVIFSTRWTSSSTLIRRPSMTQSLAMERIREKVDSLLR